MNKEQALKILIEAVNLAQNKGAYTIENSAVIYSALKVLETKKEEEKVEDKKEVVI